MELSVVYLYLVICLLRAPSSTTADNFTDVSTTVGSLYSLQCTCLNENFPPSNVYWTKCTNESLDHCKVKVLTSFQDKVTTGNNTLVLLGDDNSSLVFLNVTKDDGGYYKCEITYDPTKSSPDKCGSTLNVEDSNPGGADTTLTPLTTNQNSTLPSVPNIIIPVVVCAVALILIVVISLLVFWMRKKKRKEYTGLPINEVGGGRVVEERNQDIVVEDNPAGDNPNPGRGSPGSNGAGQSDNSAGDNPNPGRGTPGSNGAGQSDTPVEDSVATPGLAERDAEGPRSNDNPAGYNAEPPGRGTPSLNGAGPSAEETRYNNSESREGNEVTEKHLNDLAPKIPSGMYSKFSYEIGEIDYNHADNVLKKHGNDYAASVREHLNTWKNKERRTLMDLKEALNKCGLGGIQFES